MATNEVEVRVKVTGQEEISRALDDVQKGTKTVGNTFNQLSNTIDTTTNDMARGLGTVGSSVGELIGSMSELGSSIRASSGMGISGLSGLLGPLAAVAGAVYGLYQGWLQYSGAQRQAEERAEAMAAAASDLQTKLESLAEKGVTPTADAMRKFARATLSAQIAKERAQKAAEKLATSYEAVDNATEAVKAAEERLNFVRSKSNKLVSYGASQADIERSAAEDLARAKEALRLAEEKRAEGLTKVTDLSQKAGAELKAASILEKGLEEQSEDSRKAKAKELLTRLKALKLQEAEVNYYKNSAKLAQVKIDVEAEAADLSAQIEKDNAERLGKSIELFKKEIKELEDWSLRDKFYRLQRKKATTEALKADRDAAAKRANQRRAEEARRKAEADRIAREQAAQQAKQFALEGQLLQVRLQRAKGDTEQTIQLITERYNREMSQAQDNQTMQELINQRYILSLEQVAAREIAAANRAQAEKERIRARDKKLADDQAADLERRAQQGIQSYKGLAEAAMQAAAASFFYGESFKDQLAAAANSIGQQALVKALFQGAEALAFLAVGNVPSAIAAGKAAAGYAATAAAAKVVGAAAGGGGGAPAPAAASSSPIGSPQTFSTPTRETATQSQQMVFNIQMGTVYSTERNALQALTSAITREINAERRGAPRLLRRA